MRRQNRWVGVELWGFGFYIEKLVCQLLFCLCPFLHFLKVFVGLRVLFMLLRGQYFY